MGTIYSNSRISCFNSCPQQYKFRYIEKPDVPKRDTPDTVMGRAIHTVMETLYKTGADGVIVPVDSAVAEYQRYWSRANLQRMEVSSEHYTVDDYIRIGETMLRRHYDKYQPFDQGQLLGTELRLYFELPGTSIKFLAIIDKLWRRDDNQIEITDYKTGVRLPSPSDPHFVQQMGLYQMAVQGNYPQFDNIEVAQLFLRQDEVVGCRLREDQIDELTEKLYTTVHDIRNAQRLDSFPPKEGWLCNYCDYSALCPAKRHERMLDGDDEETKSQAETLRDLADRFLTRNDEFKSLKFEVDGLKKDIKAIAEERGLASLTGSHGQVTVKLARVEKFITKGKDADAFAELNHLVRELELDDYLTVDTTALMKQIYAKRRVDEDEMQKLSEFVEEVTTSRITGKWNQDEE